MLCDCDMIENERQQNGSQRKQQRGEERKSMCEEDVDRGEDADSVQSTSPAHTYCCD